MGCANMSKAMDSIWVSRAKSLRSHEAGFQESWRIHRGEARQRVGLNSLGRITPLGKLVEQCVPQGVHC